MKKLKTRICKVPGCKKEVYSPKSLFCGQHGRMAKSVGYKSLKMTATAVVAVGAYVGKKFLDN